MARCKKKQAAKEKARKKQSNADLKPFREEVDKLPWVLSSTDPCPYLSVETAARLDALGIERFCDFYIDGASLRSIARWLQVSASRCIRWLNEDAGRKALYEEAQLAQGDMFAEKAIEISNEAVPISGENGLMDSAAVNDKRLRVDTIKWISAKRNRRYGDSLAVRDETPREMTAEQINARVLFLLQKADLKVLTNVGGGSLVASRSQQAK